MRGCAIPPLFVALAVLTAYAVIAALSVAPSLFGTTRPLGATGGDEPDIPATLPPSSPPPGTSGAFETVWRSWSVSFGDERLYFVVQTQEEWESLWDRITVNPQPPPDVDFAHRTVLVAIFGVAGNGGYSIEVEGVVVSPEGSLRVSVVVSSPGPTCAVLAVINFPVHMVSVEKTEGPFAFEDRWIVEDCG